MSKTYTTGQIIDLLKPGQKAVCVSNYHFDRKVVKGGGGHFYWSDSNEYVKLTDETMNSKWQLLPQYITFEEARKAYMDGKKIRCDRDNGTYREHHISNQTKFNVGADIVLWREITDGKWSVVEDDSEE